MFSELRDLSQRAARCFMLYYIPACCSNAVVRALRQKTAHITPISNAHRYAWRARAYHAGIVLGALVLIVVVLLLPSLYTFFFVVLFLWLALNFDARILIHISSVMLVATVVSIYLEKNVAAEQGAYLVMGFATVALVLGVKALVDDVSNEYREAQSSAGMEKKTRSHRRSVGNEIYARAVRHTSKDPCGGAGSGGNRGVLK